ncbi:hypothetical protein FEM03_08080 [Phragmitibacter flavus]|uniref:Uncharacterized protein n=1 Tax=Phragmitibacter flavus TaxID=2576071 RepID=A0A5R8KGN8_9BACT|nr:hypothetical protein [Phragmitibacter flavus]TLD71474.1 hypothetical protein FEM03_08080 [Phragmitibacter flavus]
MKLVQKSLTLWNLAIYAFYIAPLLLLLPTFASAQDAPRSTAYLRFFDPNEGFKPAQTNLTNIFLQIAGSMEYYGSPEPYIEHIQAEHGRVSEKFRSKTGKTRNSLPDHLTDEYLNQLVTNWNLLSPKLGLDVLAKEAGRCTRQGIQGEQNTGTVAIEILNRHQELVFEAMKGGNSVEGGFEHLQLKLQSALVSGSGSAVSRKDVAALVEQENALNAAERKQYEVLLSYAQFTREHFGQLEQFYKTGFDKLTEEGKEEISRRAWNGTQSQKPDNFLLDAVTSYRQYQTLQTELFNKLDAALPEEASAKFKRVISGIFMDLGALAQSELEIGILESAINMK